jgi:uncharacterized protein YodC (DUF2158 family)
MTFSAGDQVRLKSGGPIMTVEKTRARDSGDERDLVIVHCIWFKDDLPCSHGFREEMIESAATEKKESDSK